MMCLTVNHSEYVLGKNFCYMQTLNFKKIRQNSEKLVKVLIMLMIIPEMIFCLLHVCDVDVPITMIEASAKKIFLLFH